MSGLLQALANMLGVEHTPGTPEHREALFRSIKERNDELAKPLGQRDQARLLEPSKRVLRLRIQACQAKKQEFRRNEEFLLQHPDLGCCSDCVRVRQRAAATSQAMAAWNEAWQLISTRRLQALEQGQPYPPLTLPYLELHLPEGLPEDLPPSIDRCATCQKELDEDEYLVLERGARAVESRVLAGQHERVCSEGVADSAAEEAWAGLEWQLSSAWTGREGPLDGTSRRSAINAVQHLLLRLAPTFFLGSPAAASATVGAATAAAGSGASTAGQYDPGRLARVWQHQYFLPPRAVQRGVHSVGDPPRLRRFAHKLLSGAPLKVAMLGGAAAPPCRSRGAHEAGKEWACVHACPQSDSIAYVPRFESWLGNVTGPGANHSVRNSVLSGVTSGIFSVCASDMVPADVDLVLLEFATNDPTQTNAFGTPERLAFERLVRKLLDFLNRPAVALLQHYAYIIAGGSHNATTSYLETAENDINTIVFPALRNPFCPSRLPGQYYGLLLLSVRAAAYHLMHANATGFKIHAPYNSKGEEVLDPGDECFYYDTIHPSGKTGHRALTDLIVGMLQEAVTGLARAPLSGEDEAAAQEPLPEPLHPGNHHRRSSTCLLLRQFDGVVLDATSAVQGELRGDTNEVVLSFLKSYAHMGRARVECVEGCSCNATTFDGYWERDASLTELHRFRATPHERCRVNVSVLGGSNSPDGGHKVKLSGVMVAEGPAFYAYGSDLDVMANFGAPDGDPQDPGQPQQEQPHEEARRQEQQQVEPSQQPTEPNQRRRALAAAVEEGNVGRTNGMKR
ncbi:hypothetical protein C2E20_2651 [Micractinium conductrix]|uniref:SGNH hydrolase-type esterase domain-containing protein n=1 Tax=Micractinium conductrix TaxID=554055 RepID=A0A2P6VJF9_9CHLO|nr:hypothetical protein C2E20_2651 [Micractinium conductrix]|eukprot:PSC74214.1 hypothetical protein C2E20_2651 [Micractinium conductrix]